MNRGLKQGCNLSPLLFALYLDDLVHWLSCGVKIGDTTIKVIMYADDIVILADSAKSLQLMINRLAEYCRIWSLEVNIDKSKVMIFQKGSGRLSSEDQWKFDGRDLEVVKQYTYLGMLLTFNLNMEKHLKSKADKAKTAICANWSKIFCNKNITLSSKYRVFNATAKSILFYGAQFWGTLKFDEVENILRFFLRKIFSLPICTPKYMFYLESGLATLFISTLKMNADILIRISKMQDTRLPKLIWQHAIDFKKGWYEDWRKLAADCGINFNEFGMNDGDLKKAFYEIIQLTDENERYAFKESARASTERKIYSKLNYNLNEANYFAPHFSVEAIRTIFHIRGEMLHLNFIPHRSDLTVICGLCNMKKKEDVGHFLGVCPILKEIRRAVFGKNILHESEILRLLDGENWMQLVVYCKEAITYRKRIISESF